MTLHKESMNFLAWVIVVSQIAAPWSGCTSANESSSGNDAATTSDAENDDGASEDMATTSLDCAVHESWCGGQCVDPLSDGKWCGALEQPCDKLWQCYDFETCIAGHCVVHTCEGDVNFPDAELAAAVRKALDLQPGAPISAHLAASISLLTVSGAQDLTGLECLSGLTTLQLANFSGTSLAPLAGPNVLEALTLQEIPHVRDLRPLHRITQLANVTFRGVDPELALSFPGSNAHLVNFSFHNTEATSIPSDFVASSLMRFDGSYNKLQEIASLRSATRLESLELRANEIRELKPLSNLIFLKWINASDNQLDSLEGLEHLPLLRTVIVSNNQITSLAPLANRHMLPDLKVHGNKISDLRPLRNVVIERLTVTANPIACDDPLQREIVEVHRGRGAHVEWDCDSSGASNR
jgi:hypothetical protein